MIMAAAAVFNAGTFIMPRKRPSLGKQVIVEVGSAWRSAYSA
jgi:hypothetical protein